MTSALFLDIPNLIKTKSKNIFPIHREDWILPASVHTIIKQHTDLGCKVFLIGNYPDVAVRKREANPIENLFNNISNNLENTYGLEANSINFDYCTDTSSFDYLPLPGMLYSLASEYDILLGYSFIATTPILGKFIKQYSSVNPVLIS